GIGGIAGIANANGCGGWNAANGDGDGDGASPAAARAGSAKLRHAPSQDSNNCCMGWAANPAVLRPWGVSV
ncbi:hypothetical protein ISG24_22285, partial [Burkholderia pseudomallei]|nr:hypothetical protein [Burkholderia pseudomallei]